MNEQWVGCFIGQNNMEYVPAYLRCTGIVGWWLVGELIAPLADEHAPTPTWETLAGRGAKSAEHLSHEIFPPERRHIIKVSTCLLRCSLSWFHQNHMGAFFKRAERARWKCREKVLSSRREWLFWGLLYSHWSDREELFFWIRKPSFWLCYNQLPPPPPRLLQLVFPKPICSIYETSDVTLC